MMNDEPSIVVLKESITETGGEDVIGPSITASTSIEESSTFSSSSTTRIASPTPNSNTSTAPLIAISTTTTTNTTKTEVQDQQSYYSGEEEEGEEEEEEEEEEDTYDHPQPAVQHHPGISTRVDSFPTPDSTTMTYPVAGSRRKRIVLDNDGIMLLHDLLMAIAESDWLTLSRLLGVVPPKLLWIRSAVLVRGCSVRLFPLHYLCTANPPVDIVEKMIQIDPLASKKMDRNGRYALHWAVDAHGSSSKVVRLLLSNHPESCCKREGRFGFLPIHIACFYPSEYSLKPQHQQQQVIEHSGKDSILHGTNSDAHLEDEMNIGCSSSTSGNQSNQQQYCSNYYYSAEEEQDALAIVQALLQTYPEGAAITDNYGWIPLHILCRTYRRGADIAQVLLTVYPQGKEHAFK
jgi:hypothetical protein